MTGTGYNLEVKREGDALISRSIIRSLIQNVILDIGLAIKRATADLKVTFYQILLLSASRKKSRVTAGWDNWISVVNRWDCVIITHRKSRGWEVIVVSSATAEFGPNRNRTEAAGTQNKIIFPYYTSLSIDSLSLRAAAGANHNDLWVIIQRSVEKQCPQRWRSWNDSPSDEDKQGNVIRAVWSMSAILLVMPETNDRLCFY